MSKYVDVVHVPEDDCQSKSLPQAHEDGVDVPLDRIRPEILQNLITEFVTREWEELGDANYTLDEKIEQVYQQLLCKKAKVVFDLASNTCNIVTCK